jgi:alpha/beta superfamily hydrolase
MAAQVPTERFVIGGAAGKIEVAAHLPSAIARRAIAVVAHPHPLFGGTMDNKVVTTIARAMFDAGAAVYRFNFRGVGKTEGSHDEGRGETEDMLRVIEHARAAVGDNTLPLWLAGFSFGGAVALAASEKAVAGEMVLVAPAFQRIAHWANVQNGGNPPASTLLIHGENDETVPLADSMDWARSRDMAVAVVPGADHFFHMRLHIIKRLVANQLR